MSERKKAPALSESHAGKRSRSEILARQNELIKQISRYGDNRNAGSNQLVIRAKLTELQWVLGKDNKVSDELE